MDANAAHASTPTGRVVFVSYDGLCDHIAQGQILPYVLGAARRGWDMTVLSHEKPDRTSAELKHVADRLDADAVKWVRLPYLASRPQAALPVHLAAEIGALLRRTSGHGPVVLHARSYVPAASAALVASLRQVPWIFDMRGFWFDEKVDAGRPADVRYRAAKRLERRLLARADAIVSLTNASRGPLQTWMDEAWERTKVTVIPTCVDTNRFTLPTREARAGRLRIGYLGSLGPRYLLADMVRVFRSIKDLRPDAHFRVLTKSDATPLHEACRGVGLTLDDYSVSSVDHAGAVVELGAMSATLSLVEPGRSSSASCPTKFAESLATGCPVVVNPGVGDCADIVRRDSVGVVYTPGTAPLPTAQALLRLLEDPGLPERCRQTATESFSLPWAVETYTGLYARLARGVS